MNKVELLAPAGNLEKAKIAIRYGADAVYIGGRQFSLRSRASNFSLDEIGKLVQFANAHQAHVHVTVNMLPHEEDIEGIQEYLLALDSLGVHAIIVASPFIMQLAKKLHSHFEVHVSTQHSTTNSSALRYWKEKGMDRVVLARECNLDEVEKMCKKQILPIEIFIHGGMCISFSGRCVLSNHMTLRDANRGGCAQSCRWKYHLMDQDQEMSHPDHLFSMSSKDLQAVAYIPRMIDMGVASLKIEGRMKSAYYLATVVSSYRHLIDLYYDQGYVTNEQITMIQNEIAKAENRETGPGFYAGIPNEKVQLYQDHDETVTQEYVGLVLDVKNNRAIVQVKNKFMKEDALEIFGPHLLSQPVELETIQDEDGNDLDICNKPMQIIHVQYKGKMEPFAMMRKRRVR